MQAPPLQAIIFDCDGTLVDSEISGMTALYDEARALGFSLPLEQALGLFRGQRMARCFALIEADIGRAVPADFEATVRRTMAGRFRLGLQTMPGAVALLQALRSAGVPYCIASNGPQEKMDLTLELSGLQGYFENHVFSGYEVGHWKPSPELFFHAAREMGVPPSACAVVEDSLPGIEAGLAAGMQVFSMCEPSIVPPDVATRIVQIEGLPDLHSAFGLSA